MKILSNTLNSTLERWSDPGDYPSGAGSCALPSRWFVSEIGGSVEIELSPEEHAELMDGEEPILLESVGSYLSDAGLLKPLQSERPEGVSEVNKWEVISYNPDSRIAELRPEKWDSE